MNKILNIGHRGAKGHIAENTLESFQRALDLGADGIEFDVHLSVDGEIIVIHDETANRTTNGSGLVKELTLAQLKKLRIENRFGIPTLAEVFDLVDHKCLINIELKAHETAKPVVDLIERYVVEKHWKYEEFLISSFDWAALQQVRDLHEEIPLGVLTHTDLDLAVAFAKFIRAETIHPYFHLLTSENTKAMQSENLKVFSWTINELEDIDKIKSYKVDGIITDFPERV
ncbi:MAG TPA: glycerophosphodiester phosphodiesterase family protein [Flavobacterium sp.]|nr:glycerophosphodiester phosphodiesterase family protein [Flavobacterium sp.]